MGIAHTQLGGLRVHHGDEVFNRSAHGHRNGVRSLVAGNQHQTVQQVAQRERFALHQPHERAVLGVPVLELVQSLDLLANGNLGIQTAVFEGDDAGENLRRAGGVQLRIRRTLIDGIRGGEISRVDHDDIRG